MVVPVHRPKSEGYATSLCTRFQVLQVRSSRLPNHSWLCEGAGSNENGVLGRVRMVSWPLLTNLGGVISHGWYFYTLHAKYLVKIKWRSYMNQIDRPLRFDTSLTQSFYLFFNLRKPYAARTGRPGDEPVR